MEVTALCITMLMIVMMLLCEHDLKADAASLHIGPNRAQFFEYESVTFYCEGVSYCEVVHESKGKISSCNKTNKRTSTGSSCTVTNIYTDDSGKYWFETGGGNKSNSVNITVTTGSVILEIPALPVMEGEAVTLTCRNKMTSSQTSADFYYYEVFISNSSTGNMIINSVSKSDEGLYKCSISGAGESAESRLTVRDSEKETVTTSFKDTSTTSSKEMVTFSSTFNPWIIVTVLLLLLLICVGLLHFVKSYWHRVVFYVSTLRPGSGSAGNQTDEDESSCRPVYYILDLDDTQQLGLVPETASAFRTAALISQRFWWPSLKEDVKLYMAACRTCACNKTPPSNGNNVIMTVVDRFSNLVHIVSLPKLPTASETAMLLVDHVFNLHGLLEDILSGRGPQIDGQMEQINHEVETLLRCMASSSPSTWSQQLSWIEYSHNSLPLFALVSTATSLHSSWISQR
ncbi:uncharacterized protein LOC113168282 [Anabas testudineus]|uniref:uncharacterized protein LOC113168282 n=1 Tax=Anabas testudineus TaxID=64144 RepID=UPI000E45677D|nr:uncharacterized protein LOC113168282 [Anabas testudineus]